jgi:hypothetical protein
MSRNPSSARFTFSIRTILAIAFFICALAMLVWPAGALMRSANRAASRNDRQSEESECGPGDGQA